MVHQLIESGGGYWEGLAAIARLLEELGELAEEIEKSTEKITAEAADVLTVVISLCIQYRIDISAPTRISLMNVSESFGKLVENCGYLARVINHVEGHKPAKEGEQFHDIHEKVSEIPEFLCTICSISAKDLYNAAAAEIIRKTRRDSGRFQNRIDPCCAPILLKLGDRGLATAPLYSNMIGASKMLKRSELSSFTQEVTRFSRIAEFTPDSVMVFEVDGEIEVLSELQHILEPILPSVTIDQIKQGNMEYVNLWIG